MQARGFGSDYEEKEPPIARRQILVVIEDLCPDLLIRDLLAKMCAMTRDDIPTDGLILVTGAGGFIGSNIALALAAKGVRVVLCDDLGQDSRWLNVRDGSFHDIVAVDGLPGWLDRHSGELRGIVHMGAISATTETDVDLIVARNTRSTLDLWEVATREKVPFVYASSAATYGDGRAGFDDESTQDALARLRPLNAYAWSKHLIDRRLLRDRDDGRPTPPSWAGLKFFNVYGPRESHKKSMRSVIHQIWPKAARGETVRLFKSDNPDYDDGGQLRDFVHVDDCVHFATTALATPGLAGIYNVGTGKARSFRDLALATFAAVERQPRIEYIDMPEALKGRYQYFTEARTERGEAAGLAPNYRSLEDGVADYAAWLRANPEF
jgi:ADP-L-glycero-D-manno-heptose 6-epimerase